MVYRLSELAQIVGATLRGDGTKEIQGVAPLERATAREIAFCTSSRYRSQLDNSQAGAVILTAEDAEGLERDVLVCPDPRGAFARVAATLYPEVTVAPGWHASAIVDDTAQVDPSASIGPYVVIEEGAVIGPNTRIDAGSFVGARVRIGARTRIEPRVVIMHDCVIGDDCQILPGAVIGGDGFGYAREKDGRWTKVPQLGRVIIGSHVDIGANTTIDRGALDDTIIADGAKLDNLIQIAHNVKVGNHTAMGGCVGVAGSATIGSRCLVGGGVGILGHITIGNDVEITGMSFMKDSAEGPGRFSSSMPAMKADMWAKNVGRLRHIDDLARRLRRAEHAIKQLLSGGKP